MKRLLFALLLLTLAGNAMASLTFTPLLADPEVTGSPAAWTFTGNAYLQHGGFCADPNYGSFGGGFGTMTQTFTIPMGGPNYNFTYDITVLNPNTQPYQGLELNLYDAANGQFVAHIDSVSANAVSLACTNRTVSLGSHSDWAGRTFIVRIDGYTYYGVNFRLESAQMIQITGDVFP